MAIFDWIAAGIVIVSMIYISFALTVADWLVALRKGQAVSLLPERGGRKYPLWMQIALMVVGLLICIPLFYYGWVPLFKIAGNTKTILKVVGLIIYLAGFGFTLWARRTLGKYWGLSTSLDVKLFDEHQLIQSGPYAFVRHPMYFGAWIFMFGLLLLYPTWTILILLVSMLTAFSGRARREEVALAERFGDSWVEYKQRTWFIIP